VLRKSDAASVARSSYSVPMAGITDSELTDAEAAMYAAFRRGNLIPLWTEIGDLMPRSPRSRAVAHLWRWSDLLSAARTAGALVPVGRGGERRAIALANPGLDDRPFATSTLWAAIQYLNAGESAPGHRHSQHAFRFVVEGEGVWTVVGGDAVSMRRGDFLPQSGWNWHSHVNLSTGEMTWIDGLDIPLQYALDATFFEPGSIDVGLADAPERSRSERLWGHPGLRPADAVPPTTGTPLLVYRWEHTDRALNDQLELDDDRTVTAEAGHAIVRYSDPVTGGDVLPTIRAEFHRFRPGVTGASRREVGSSVVQVFTGSATVSVGDQTWTLEHGDLFVVPSWQPWQVRAGAGGVDLFRFSDAPVMERLGLSRSQIDGAPTGADGGHE
jgi:gentisate 1,2-dioxygenase